MTKYPRNAFFSNFIFYWCINKASTHAPVFFLTQESMWVFDERNLQFFFNNSTNYKTFIILSLQCIRRDYDLPAQNISVDTTLFIRYALLTIADRQTERNSFKLFNCVFMLEVKLHLKNWNLNFWILYEI